MPQLVNRRRSGWAALAVGALVASLLVVGSPPAGAAEIKVGTDNAAAPNKRPSFSACVGEAMRSAGFEDTEGLVAEDAINCLAYYGITTGKTAERFDAGSEVTRSQMALFLYRAADVAGLDLMGGIGAADFDDIADLDEERRNAIVALARNNILPGSGMAFYPHANITRAQMAMALVEFLRHANPGLFHQSGTMKGQLILASGADLDHFADARMSEPTHVDTAISYAYELGITTGSAAGADMFSPSDPVLRKNMASFIARTLAHTNLRPAGLTAQNVGGTITASIRDDGFDPVSNELVDAFYIATVSEDKAFDDMGACRLPVTKVDSVDSTECGIGWTDLATDAGGNVQLSTLSAAAIGKGVTVWVWTGDMGDRFDADRIVAYELRVQPGASLAATAISYAPDITRAPHYRFGTEVEIIAQLKAGTADTKVGADGNGPAQFTVQIKTYNGGATSMPVLGRTNSPAGVSSLVTQTEPRTVWSDADGKVRFTLDANDPDPSATSLDDYRTVQFILTNGKNAPGYSSGGTVQSGWIVFSDVPSRVQSLSAMPVNAYAVATGRPVPNGVVVVARNQYGEPIRGVSLTLTSDVNTSDMPTARSTTSSGNVRMIYSHRGNTPVKETLTVTYTPTSGAAMTDTAIVYWVHNAINTTNVREADDWPVVVAGSVERNEIVVDWSASTSRSAAHLNNPGTYQVVRYDSNDYFKWSDATTSSDFATMEAFEEKLASVLKRLSEGGTNVADLRWDSYDWDDEYDRALFELKIN